MEELYRKFVELAIAKKTRDIFIEPKGSTREKYQVNIKVRNFSEDNIAFRIHKSGIPVLSTLHGGSIEQVRKYVAAKEYRNYNLFFQSMKKGKSPEFKLISN